MTLEERYAIQQPIHTVVFDPSVSNSCIDFVSKHRVKSLLNDYTVIKVD